jgi:threonyl-tRNA synthetase
MKEEQIRHSLAHMLAIQVLEFDPGAKLAIGPVIDNGFYYDFEFSEGKQPTEKDLKTFQKGMKKLTNKKLDFTQEEVSEEEAKKIFTDQQYKLELIDELIEKGEKLTIYRTGDFVDLCAGPHVDNTGEINADAFELTKIAGAYWRGDENNKMLTRIYGVAFETPEELKVYQERMKRAEEIDHRKIGKEMDLFTFSDLVGPGLPLYTPKGTAVIDALQKHIEKVCREYGFEKVKTPHLSKIELFETSGHAQKFADELFSVTSAKKHDFALKPVQCPHQTQIYASKIRSYKDLPIRYMESDRQYRAEKSGEVGGLGRVYAITVEDGHVFCTVDQIKDEIRGMVNIIKDFYEPLGLLDEYWVSLSVRDQQHPENYIGDEEDWVTAETMLQEISDEMGLNAKRCEGEAALYGPKLDFMFKDAMGKEIQIPTVQLDFATPKRFNLTYIDDNGQKTNPVMIHRAILGSYERLMVILIEHFEGKFPYWLAPVQVKVIPVADSHIEKAQEVYKYLKSKDVRVELDDSNDGFGKKVRNAKVERVPYFIILGDTDIENGTVTLESRDNGQIGSFTIKDIIEQLK